MIRPAPAPPVRADADPAPPPAPPAALRHGIPLLLALALTAACGLLGTQQWRALEAPSWDLGIFTQLAKAYGTFSAPIVPIKGDDVNLLGDHFHPILVLLAPVWWVWPSGLALLWTQAALFGLSAIPLTRLAIDRLGLGLGALAGLAYTFSFGLQSAAAVQFHEIAFAVPLLAFSLTALLRGRVTAAVAWAAPLVLVKEDLGLTVLVLGAVIAWRHRDRWREGAALACWGAGWFLASTVVILPLLNTAGQYDYTDNLGSVLEIFWPPAKYLLVIMLVLAAGVIGLRSPLILLLLPTLAWRFTGTVEFYWDWYWHYNAVLMPVVTAAMLDALGDRRTGRAVGWTRTDLPRPRRAVQVTAVLAALAVTLVLGTRMPLLDVLRPAAWEPSPRAASAQAALEAVPDGAVTAVDITLLAPAVTDHEVQWMHGPNTRVPDCVLMDTRNFAWGGTPPADPAAWSQEQWGADYAVRYAEDGFVVLCRP